MSDLSDLSDKMGAPVFALTGYAVASHGITPGVCCAAVWFGSGNVMATVVCVLRGRGACIRRIRRIRLIFNDEGAPLYTPGVCCAAVWYGSGEDVPFG